MYLFNYCNLSKYIFIQSLKFPQFLQFEQSLCFEPLTRSKNSTKIIDPFPKIILFAVLGRVIVFFRGSKGDRLLRSRFLMIFSLLLQNLFYKFIACCCGFFRCSIKASKATSRLFSVSFNNTVEERFFLSRRFIC